MITVNLPTFLIASPQRHVFKSLRELCALMEEFIAGGRLREGAPASVLQALKGLQQADGLKEPISELASVWGEMAEMSSLFGSVPDRYRLQNESMPLDMFDDDAQKSLAALKNIQEVMIAKYQQVVTDIENLKEAIENKEREMQATMLEGRAVLANTQTLPRMWPVSQRFEQKRREKADQLKRLRELEEKERKCRKDVDEMSNALTENIRTKLKIMMTLIRRAFVNIAVPMDISDSFVGQLMRVDVNGLAECMFRALCSEYCIQEPQKTDLETNAKRSESPDDVSIGPSPSPLIERSHSTSQKTSPSV